MGILVAIVFDPQIPFATSSPVFADNYRAAIQFPGNGERGVLCNVFESGIQEEICGDVNFGGRAG